MRLVEYTASTMHFPKTRRGEVAFRCVRAAAFHLHVHVQTREGQRAATVGFAISNGMMFGKGRDPEVTMVTSARVFLRRARHIVPGHVFRTAVKAGGPLPKR